MRPTAFDRVETPEQLEKYVRGVKAGILQSLIIVGRGGTGKSSVVRDHLPDVFSEDGAAWKSGRISPVQFYQHLYWNCDRPIVLDDAPDIARDLKLAGLLRQLCETQPRRTISWDTQNKAIGGEEGIPSSFETTSRFILITNQWMDRHPEVEALETRCHIVKYEPSVETLHARAKDLPGVERSVWKYVDAAVKEGRVHQINYRDYITASQRLQLGVDWRAILEQQFLPDEVEDLDRDEDVIRGWFLRSGKKELAARDLLMGPRRFRGQKELVEGLLARMVGQGTLIEVRPPQRDGQRGRPPASRYALAATASRLCLVG
jgi:hypothetical protein